MATRSTISVLRPDGKVATIYCHWDGYLDGVGLTLHKYFDYEKALRLMDLGSLSDLGTDLTLESGTIAYHRDRSESWEVSKTRVNDRIWEAWADQFEDYGYYHDSERWHFSIDRAGKPLRLFDQLVRSGHLPAPRPRTRICVPKPIKRALIL